jgi:histidinol-phosphate phosphatase family protein
MSESTSKTDSQNGAVFLDRDGTIIHEVNYLHRLEDIKLLPRVGEAIARLNQRQIPVILISNQSGVARGRFTVEFVNQSHRHLQKLLQEKGAHLDDFFFCPHHPQAGNPPYKMVCNCRKPAPGMILAAAHKHHLDLKKSYVIGDKLIDIELARKTGERGILVETGYGLQEKEQIKTCGITPDKICIDLNQAINWILKHKP